MKEIRGESVATVIPAKPTDRYQQCDMNKAENREIQGESSNVAVNGDGLLDDAMRSRHSRRRTSLGAYVTMLGLLLLGLLTAASHHLFYTYLNNRELEESAVPQNWAIRIGNAFAYLFKALLVSAVWVAYAQGFWYFVRRKWLEIGSLDNLFDVLYNPLSFFDTDLFQKTTPLFGLAIVSWLLPLSGVLAPGALTGYRPFRLI